MEEQTPLKETFKEGSGNKSKGNWQYNHGKNKNYPYFGVAGQDQVVKRFKLIFKTGKMISIPYAMLPIIYFDPVQNLTIKTSELVVSISGRSLHIIEDFFSMELVTWIKESPTQIDDGKANSFVSEIRIENEIL